MSYNLPIEPYSTNMVRYVKDLHEDKQSEFYQEIKDGYGARMASDKMEFVFETEEQRTMFMLRWG